LQVGFSRSRVEIASGEARSSYRTLGLWLLELAQAARVGGPVASANCVSYERGSLKEWYANGPLGVEQGFDLGARPSSGLGPVTLSLAVSAQRGRELDHGSFLLARKGVALRYAVWWPSMHVGARCARGSSSAAAAS